MRHEKYMKEKMKELEADEEQLLGAFYADKPDMVNSPPHYNEAGIECIEAIQAATGDGFEYHLQGTALKYLWRFRYKGKPLEDLKKCRWYLDKLIEEYEK